MRKPCPFHNSYTCGCYDSVNIPDKEWNKRPEEERLKKEINRLRKIVLDTYDALHTQE